MKAMTISEAFRAVIGEREVMQAFFSTYSFEPDFFELEVLGLLTNQAGCRFHVATQTSEQRLRFYTAWAISGHQRSGSEVQL